ncbi:BnaC03g35180D [Brassica napus]|uniref:BnaC03g35180D protein n=1 Tax=Brassica napus TaxID=3708 RepID=A0A078F0N6_BRANA|nr:BnaC03g35180D [Brassica napus]
MISLVNTVIIGAHAVMANGGVIGPVGLAVIRFGSKLFILLKAVIALML